MGIPRPVVPLRYLLPLLCFSFLLLQFGLSLSDVPSLKLMQDIICKKHYDIAHDETFRPEHDCLVEPVQRQLNLISIGNLVSVTVAGALVSIPFGMLADQIGRVPVLAMSVVGILFAQVYAVFILWRKGDIPLEAIWGTGVPILLGGGRGMAEAMVFTLISDSASTSRQATFFQWIVGAVLLGQFAGPLLANVLLDKSIWLPLVMSLGIILFASLLLIFFTPETRQMNTTRKHDETQDDTTRVSRGATIRAVFSVPALWLVPGTILTMPVATMQSELILRAMPIQFDWTLKRSALLLCLRSISTLVTLLVILPGISWLILRYAKCQQTRRDLILVQGSTLFFIFGSLCLTMVKNETLVVMGVCISTLGSGLPTLCRALLVTLLRDHQVGFLFGILAVGEVLGMLGCQLLLGWLFDVSLQAWTGLPFCAAFFLALVSGAATWMLRFIRMQQCGQKRADLFS